ncbi:MAG: hypothetical protein ABWZ57_20035 [Mesorhizobium sp.]
MPITPGSGRVSGHKTIRRTDATPKLPRLRQVPPRPGTTKDIENAMQPGAGLGGGKGIEAVRDADVWSLLKNEPRPEPALMKQAVMTLFAEGGAFASSSVPNAGKIAEYLRHRFDELDDLDLILAGTLYDDRNRALGQLLCLAHLELEGSGEFPSGKSAEGKEFPELPPAMTDLIASLINSDAIDRDTIESLIADRDPPLDDDEPASFRDSFSALEQIEIEALITAALDRPQRERPASEASKVNDEPGREISRGRLTTPRPAQKSKKTVDESPGPRRVDASPGQRRVDASPGPKTLVAAPKLKPTWQDDPFYVPFVALVSEYQQMPDHESKCIFLYRHFANDTFHGLFLSSANTGKDNLPKLIAKLNREIGICLHAHKDYRNASEDPDPRRSTGLWLKLKNKQRKLIERFDKLVSKAFVPLKKSY